MKKFSLLVPTRDRDRLALGLINSFKKTTKNPDDVEILFVCDDDDRHSQSYVKGFQMENPHLDIQLFTRPRTEFLNNDYYNWLAGKATGELIWIMADDLELVEEQWDERIFTAYTHYRSQKPDGVFCISPRDNTPVPRADMKKFPCFPIFTREAIAFFGWALHPQVPTWGADYITYMIYISNERILQLHDVNYLNHISVHTHQCAEDATCSRIGHIFNKMKMIPEYNTDRILSEEVPQLRLKLASFIGEQNERMG